MLHKRVHEYYCNHGLYHWYSAGQHAGVVPSLSSESCFLTLSGHGLLLLADGTRWFKGDPNDNILTVGYSALDATTSIRSCACATVLVYVKFVVMVKST